MKRLSAVIICTCIAWTSAVSLSAGPQVPDTYPWVNVNRHFGASIRSGRVVPVRPNSNWGMGMTLKDGGVYLYGSDVSGWTASVDGGQTFDNANSGRVFSNNVCGGYPADWYSDGGDAASAAECGPTATPALRPYPEGGPPSARPGFTGTTSNVNEVASGPAPVELAGADVQGLCRGPTGVSGCAKDVIYAANNALMTFSPDAGRQWFPLSPACELRRNVTFSSIAADRGKPGHVVALASHFSGHGQAEASGCDAEPKTKLSAFCALRTIAYTQNVGEELKESILATKITNGNTASDGKSRLERAGGGGAEADVGGADAWKVKDKWRYATINNLPAPARIGGTCAIGAGFENSPGMVGWVIGESCTAEGDHHCHGRKSKDYKSADAPVDPAAWCLDPAKDECKCLTGPADQCRYPTPTHLEIDPRNGWAYLSSDVGLLTSPDGGGHWIRRGHVGTEEEAKTTDNPADKFNNHLGAALYTHQFVGNNAEYPTKTNSLNLQHQPARIKTMGKLSLAFTPCPTDVKYAGSQRRRGHLVATLPVEWIAPNGQRRSSLFIASEPANCDARVSVSAPDAMVFVDSADHDRS